MTKSSYSDEFKARVVLEALREEKTANQIASERGIDPSLVSKWKLQAVGGLYRLFASKTEADKIKIDYERKIDDLHRIIGARQVEIEWLKKKLNLM